ncbi:hypothetical protein ACK3SF_03685 [Candidatus Nanosalina sp. VS9-1]|uniref:hypothetical protein n=1 Tax=Candidatus Nanosalina sp. VS9-1 TaxID=3388566 RepID=UPI0039DFA658
MSDIDTLFRGTSLQRLLTNLEDGELKNNEPARIEYEGDIPPLRTVDVYMTSSPTRAASFARSIHEENKVDDLDRPLIIELETDTADLDRNHWEQSGVTDYTSREVNSENITAVYTVDEGLGQQHPKTETVDLSEHESWELEEYIAMQEMFPGLSDASYISENF